MAFYAMPPLYFCCADPLIIWIHIQAYGILNK